MPAKLQPYSTSSRLGERFPQQVRQPVVEDLTAYNLISLPGSTQVP